MHGVNESRPREVSEYLQVAEIFYTIQGEGPYSGMPAIFIRLTGCNLHCHFCDTVWDDANDPKIHWLQVLEKVKELAAPLTRKPLIVLTGGEPVRQDCGPLVRCLAEYYGFTVQVETAGSYWQDWLHETTIVCSPKTRAVHRSILDHCNHWKYIVRTGEINAIDGLPSECTQFLDPKKARTEQPTEAFNILRKYGVPVRPPQRENVVVWLSPCDEGNEAATLRNMDEVSKQCMLHGYRAQIQVHKVLRLR